LVKDEDDTRPITCAKCGRSFVSPRWLGWQGPLCTACYDRLLREEEVRRDAAQSSRTGIGGWLKGLFGG
jgi:hypothetical protein